MKHHLFLLVTLLASPAANACDGGQLYELMDTALPSNADKSVDVEHIQSTEGGEWSVFLGLDRKTPQNIMRTDYGETGRLETRLIVSSPVAYAITVTKFTYSVPIYIEGSSVIREEKDIYVYCDGKLDIPQEKTSLVDYKVAAAKAMKTFEAQEIAPFIGVLKTKPF